MAAKPKAQETAEITKTSEPEPLREDGSMKLALAVLDLPPPLPLTPFRPKTEDAPAVQSPAPVRPRIVQASAMVQPVSSPVQRETEVSTPASSEVQSKTPALVKNRDRWDWVIASLCISFGVVGLRTVNDPVLWSQLFRGHSTGETIGTLIHKKGGVRYRTNESPVWHDLQVGKQDVAEGDTVFTGDSGQAELVLKDGSVAEIQPNSLIVVQKSSEVIAEESTWGSTIGSFFVHSKSKSVLRIERGGAKVALNKASSALKLQVKGKVYKLSSEDGAGAAEISVDGLNAGTKIASLSSGSLKLAEAAGEGSGIQVGQGQQAVLGTRAALQKLAVSAVAPSAGEELLQEPESAVAFQWKWEGNSAATNAQGYLELEGPESKSIPIATTSDIARESLKSGAYRWRLVVEFAGAERVETLWRSFNLTTLAPPAPIGPVSGAWIDLAKGQQFANVAFTWTPVPSQLKAEIEWSEKKKDGDTTVPSSHVQEADFGGTQLKLAPGRYQWRVRARTADRDRVSPWSESMDLKIRSDADAQAADEREAPSAVMAPIAAPPVAPAPVTVAPPAPMPSLLTPPSLPKVARVAPPKEVLRKPDPPPKPIRVLAIPQQAASTRLGKLERLDQVTIPLHWAPIEDVRHYDVWVKDDATHKVVLNKRTATPALDFVLYSLESTHFTYQVTATANDGEKIVSAPVPIEVSLTPPTLKTPADGAKVVPNRQGTILVTWERTVLTDSYIIQISRDKNFAPSLVREETAPRNLLGVRGLTISIPYYWRVQAVTHGHRSDWSKPSMFMLDMPSDTDLFSSDPSRAPSQSSEGSDFNP